MTRVTTTCPQCNTIFRVNPEQLAARRGQVRCGRCRHVFNGYETVSVGPDLQEAELAPPVKAGQAVIRRSGALGRLLSWRPRWSRSPRRKSSSAADRSDSALARTEGLAQMADLVRRGPSADRVEPGAMRLRPAFQPDETTRQTRSSRSPLERLSETLSPLRRKQQQRITQVLVGLAVLAIPVLMVLARGPLVGAAPGLRPALVLMCMPLGLSVPWPGDADLWTVESHELKSDADHPEVFQLVATLRNRADHTQAYPTLELILTDVEGLTVESLVTPPSRYLPTDHGQADGLAANSEVAIKTEIRPHSKATEGYRLVLFYP